MIVNQKELAQCLGISARRIRQLREEGLFKSEDDKGHGYNLERCIQEYIEYKVNAETGRTSSISKEKVQAEHEEVKKQISILKLRRLRRELHEAADVEYFLTDMLSRFKNRIMSLPPKIVMITSGEDSSQAIRDVQELLESALDELSEYNPEEIEHGADAEDFDDDEYDADDDDEEDEDE